MRGKVVWFYAFDVANEIYLRSVQEVLATKPVAWDVKVQNTAPREFEWERPLTIHPDSLRISTPGGHSELELCVKVFDFGVISLAYELKFDVEDLTDLLVFHQPRFGTTDLLQSAIELARRVAEDLRPFSTQPSFSSSGVEAYTVFCVAEASDDGRFADFSRWIHDHRRGVAALLCEEEDSNRLAMTQVDETMRLNLSYSTGDAAVIDWDAAFLANDSGYFDDVLYVLELANLQIEEYRILDDRLDRFFVRAYTDLERYYARRFALRYPEQILRKLRAIRMDMTRMAEEVGNVTKFVGDWHLARIYLLCRDRFHLAFWQSSLERKLDDLDDIYSIVRSEINERRMLLLEAMIVLLFVFDIAFLIAEHWG